MDDTVLRLLNNSAIKSDKIIDIARVIFKDRDIYLVIDDTLMEKMYSKLIEGTSDNRDHSTGQVYRSLCSVTAMLTDGNRGIAIDHMLWTSREMSADDYKSKTELAQGLLEHIMRKVPIKMVIMDGLYATKDFILWLFQKRILFEMRFHSNRRLTDDFGKSFLIRDNPALALKGKKGSITIKAYWNEIPLFFTAVKRKSKNGFITLYQVSNYQTTSATHKSLYSYRWNIEKFFRTAKQHLGLKDCQSRKLTVQKNHIMNVFFAYALLQLRATNQKLRNPETALKRIKKSFITKSPNFFFSADQIFRHGGLAYA